MKTRLAVLLMLAAAMPAWAVRSAYNGDTSVTSSNSAISFTDNGSGGTSAAFRARYVLVRSLPTSANTCFFDMKDTVATTADTALAPGDSIEAFHSEDVAISGMGAICSGGQTATFRITAYR